MQYFQAAVFVFSSFNLASCYTLLDPMTGRVITDLSEAAKNNEAQQDDIINIDQVRKFDIIIQNTHK